MASFVITNAQFIVNSTDLSDHVTSVTVNTSKDDVENTAMASTGYKSHLAGLGQFSIDVEFNQDFASSNVDATLWSIYNTGTSVTFQANPINTTITATNPKWTGSVLLLAYAPIDGQVGALAKTKVTFTGTGAITRGTS